MTRSPPRSNASTGPWRCAVRRLRKELEATGACWFGFAVNSEAIEVAQLVNAHLGRKPQDEAGAP
jgi:hypothetical protein